jgi:hypothetical protein
MKMTVRVPRVIASSVARIAASTEAQPLIAQAHGTRCGASGLEAREREREGHAHEEGERRDQGERQKHGTRLSHPFAMTSRIFARWSSNGPPDIGPSTAAQAPDPRSPQIQDG